MTPRLRSVLFALRLALLGLFVCSAGSVLGGCAGGSAERAAAKAAAGGELFWSKDRPPIAAVIREGDPAWVFGAAATTEGIAPSRGANVAVSLAALVELRLGVDSDVKVTASWDGITLHLLSHDGRGAPAVTERLRRALLTPVTPGELAPVRRRLDALARRPLADPGLESIARCRGEPFGAPGAAGAASTLELTELEGWRRKTFGLGRVALAAVGDASTVQSVAFAVAHGPAWPLGAPPAPAQLAAGPQAPVVYDGAPVLAAGEAVVTLAFATDRARRPVAAAEGLADEHGPLRSRLSALEGAPHITDIAATAHPRGGCLSVKVALSSLGPGAAERIATAVAVVRQEVAVELTDAAGRETTGLLLAKRSGDPREAAERAAFWTLLSLSSPPPAAEGPPRLAVAIAVGRGRDAPTTSSATAASKGATPAVDPLSPAGLGREIDRAVAASKEPVIESRIKVERGQGELWLALGSPCGTLAETDLDAGLSGAFALVAAASADGHDAVAVEPLAAADAIGLIAHAPLLPGEQPLGLAHRVADVAARSFAADPVDRTTAAHVRADLLARNQAPSQRGLLTAAAAVVPGHTSFWLPLGSGEAFGRATDAALSGRASVVRSGPLRVAVLANVDAAQGAEAARAADRWVARRPGEQRACPAVSTPPPPRPGTYAVESGGHGAEAWIAIPLPRDDDAARADALLVAAMLDGQGGLLEVALKSAGLAREFGARVLGPPRGSALVVHLASSEGALDAAVAQTRALLDRLRQGAMTERDRQRGLDAQAREAQRAALDPRSRLLGLFRDASRADAPPALAALRAFAAGSLRDESLVLVAVRPPRFDPTP